MPPSSLGDDPGTTPLAPVSNQVPIPESDMEAPEERALIARVLAGDRLAARELYDAQAPRVYRVVFRLTRDAGLAEEYTQDTFVKVFTRLTTFRGESRLSTWIHRIAVTMALNGLRTRRRRADRELTIEAVEALPAPAAEVEPDLRDRIRAAIEALPGDLSSAGGLVRPGRLHARRDLPDARCAGRHLQIPANAGTGPAPRRAGRSRSLTEPTP